jgi:N-formylglutamate amidohydrolase
MSGGEQTEQLTRPIDAIKTIFGALTVEDALINVHSMRSTRRTCQFQSDYQGRQPIALALRSAQVIA